MNNQINEIANKVILKKYPLWKQLNLIRNGGDELDAMSVFINLIVDKSNEQDIDIDSFIAFCLENDK